jgi:PKD repeat protein
MRMPSRSLVSPSTKMGLTSVVVFAIAIILLPSNITIINAQQQQQQQPPTISQSPAEVAQNGATTFFQSATDGIRLNVPEGWIVHDVNNTGSTRSEESRQGYGILAQLCPQELQQQQEQQRAAPSNVSRSSRDTASCQGSEGDVIHIVRYPDLDVRLQEVSSNITAHNNMTIDNILLYHMQKLEEVGYSGIQIVNSTDTTLNVTNATNAQTNQTIAIVPARLVEVTYSTASAPNVIREGYFMLTATDETRPNIGMTKGYSIFYEGASISAGAATPATIQQTTTSTPFVSLPSRQPLPIAVQQIFDSVELIVVSEVAQDMPPAQSEQVQQQEVAQEPTNPLTVDITSRGTEGEGDVGIAPASFEFQADIAGGTEPYSYRWDFDDGGSSEEGDDDVVDHTFEEAGTYSIGLTVTDSDGQTASDIIEITVEEALAEEPVATEEEEEAAPSLPPTIIEPPAEEEEQPITTEQPLTVDITSSDTEGRVIAPTTFEFEAYVAGGTEPYTISWNFDDEGTSSEEIHDDETISHTFEEAGKYNVAAIVTDSSGQRAADTIRITVEEAPSLPSVIRELAEEGEDATSEDNLPPQQQDQQSDAAPSTGATEEIPSEQPTAQGNNQVGEQGEATTARPPSVTQSIQQNTSQSMQVGIPNGGTSSEERSDENVDHIFDEAGSHNRGRTVTNIEDQRVSDSVESKVEAALVEPPEEEEEEEEEEPSTQETPAEQPTAGEVNPDLFDADNNSDDLIDVGDVFDVDGFIDGLFDKLGLDN